MQRASNAGIWEWSPGGRARASDLLSMCISSGHLRNRWGADDEAVCVVAQRDRGGAADPGAGRGAGGSLPAVPELADRDRGEEGRAGDARSGPSGSRTAPPFSLPDTNGNIYSSAQLAGKPAVINFFATWCPPCKEEIPGFVEVYNKHKAEGVRADRHLARHRHAGEPAGIPDEQQDRIQDPFRGPGHRPGVRRGLRPPDHLLRGKGRGDQERPRRLHGQGRVRQGSEKLL